MRKTLLFATHNDHKADEIRHMLGNHYEIKTLSDLGFYDEIPETGSTLTENAIIKARFLFNRLNVPVFAEDSGLEVDALDMAPGVHTARYAGPQRNNNDNISLLLQNLRHSKDRKAQFRAIISYIDSSGSAHNFEGIVRGCIASTPTGDKGFGYDPVFIPDGYHQTFAQLGDDVKSMISHRKHALDGFITFLESAKSS